MSEIFKDVEPMVYNSRINVPYRWWAGDTASRFFISLRDGKKIMGTKCARCGKVFIPPRKTCPVCFTGNDSWVEVSPVGTVNAFTIVRRQLASLPGKVPVIYGLIKLEGADTSLLHIINGAKPEEMRIGMKVEAHFAKKTTGVMFDIEYFKPAK